MHSRRSIDRNAHCLSNPQPGLFSAALLAVGILLTGCATATSKSETPDASQSVADARPSADAMETVDAVPSLDASPDAPAITTRVLSQNTVLTPIADNSSSCNEQATGFVAGNSFYRVFPLAANGITTPFAVTKVMFGTELANAGIGASQAAQVKIHNYTGVIGTTLNMAQMTLINAVNITIADTTTPTTQEVAIAGTVPANGALVVELTIPDGRAVGNEYYIGSNKAGQTAPGYIRAPTCGDNSPRSLDALNLTMMHVVLNATGTI